MNKLASLSGYNRLGNKGSQSGSMQAGDIVTASTGLFTSIFNPLVNARSTRELAQLENDARRVDIELANARSEMANAQSEAELNRLQRVQAELQNIGTQIQQRAGNLNVLAQTEGKSISPLGWVVIASAVGGGAYMLTRKKKRRK